MVDPTIRWKSREKLNLLNTEYPRVDAPAKVTGSARFSHDMRLPGMVYGRLVMVPASRATIESIDLSQALATPGVVLAELAEEDKDRVRYLGDDAVVAIVCGTSPETAQDGVRAVQIAWTPEDNMLVSEEQISAPDAAKINRRGNLRKSGERGDADKTAQAFGSADVQVSATYSVPVQHHLCLETHGCVVDYNGGDEATVYASTQAVSGNTGSFARHLGLKSSQVRVVCQHMGGGFGSKFGIGLEGALACRAARQLKRPVHLMLDRKAEFLMTGNRSGSRQVMRAGASKDGRIVALDVEAFKFGGTSGGSLPTPPYMYQVEEAYAKITTVHQALDGNRAMRAPGHPQASFAMESMVDELAYGIGMDPLEFRIKNLSDEAHHRQLRRVAKEIGWDVHPNRTGPGKKPLASDQRAAGAPRPPAGDHWCEGIGFGVSRWGGGGRGGARCEVRIDSDGSVTSSCAVQDLGTGSRTYVGTIVAEELGLGLTDVKARIGDSALPPGVASGGSVTTGSVAPAVQHAALLAREALEKKLEPVLGAEPGAYTFDKGRVFVTDDPKKSLSWQEACALLGRDPLVVTGKHQGKLADGGVHGSQAVRVAVNTRTGQIKVLDMVAVQSQGLTLNRLATKSQINGGMVGALSYALFEQRVLDADFGNLLSANMEDYKIAGAKDIPRMRALIDDDDMRPTVSGMAEGTGVPGAGAIANAVYNACGARVRHLPLTPDRVLEALKDA
jgi:xanthine dehydrogenase YagR molybdenum-binding subunit